MNKNTLLIIKPDQNGQLKASDHAVRSHSFVFGINNDKLFLIKQNRQIFDQESYPISELKNLKRKIMNTKPAPNTAAINSLKQQGFKVSINHWRKKLWKDKKEPLIADKAVRENQKMGGFGYEMVSQNGGCTEVIIQKGEEKIVVRADCYAKDSFAKKIGVLECLKRLEKLHNIKA